MIISRTPLRISLVGGGTDLPSYYTSNDYGAVLSSSINKYLYVTVKKQPKIFHEKFRLNYSETELVQDLNEIKNPIIKECLKFMQIDDSLYISTISDVPSQTGLGSSSTFCVGLLNALYAFKKEKISLERLSEEAAHIEVNILQRPMGKQDHYAASIGGLNYLVFNQDGTVEVCKVKISEKNRKILQNSLIVFWTGITRPSEKVLYDQNERHKENAINLTKIRDQVFELKSLLEENKLSIKKIGKLINAGWQIKKTFSNFISTEVIDNIYSQAIKSFAYGGKICGAGGGGFFLFLAEPNYHKDITKMMKKFNLERFNLSLGSKGTEILINL